MSELLPGAAPLTITSTAGDPTPQKLQKLDHLLILTPDSFPVSRLKKLPAGSVLQRLKKRIGDKSAIPAAQSQLTDQTGVSLVMLPAGVSPFKLLDLSRQFISHGMRSNPATLGVLVSGFDEAGATAATGAIAAAALAAVSRLPTRKSDPKPAPRLRRLRLFGNGAPDLRRLRAENEGNHLARWLTALPPNDLDAAGYRKRITELAKTHGWELDFLDVKQLARRGAGAFLAVAQGGDKNAGIAHLKYRPDGGARKRPDVALVGKGICFDTGGVNLKPARGMQNMHDDMQGSAVALGTLTALTQMQSELNVDCWLAITENLIGPEAYKPMDVVTASNGTTIEIIHTDAEGRMALADTLALAAKSEPRVMIDYATLTGACVGAVTERYSGAFSNRPELNPVLITAGAQCGERVWPFPMDDDFDAALSSTIADVKQCTLDGMGDHILAARFLSRFAGSGAWIHIDLSAGRHKGGLAHIPSDVTGFGVRLTMNLLHEQELLKHSQS